MGLPIYILVEGPEIGIKYGNKIDYYLKSNVQVYSTQNSMVGLIDLEKNSIIIEAKTTDYRDPKEASVKDLVVSIKSIIGTIPANELTQDELDAIRGANNPSSTNVFVTFLDMIASLIGFTPNGDITSTNTQDAIVEVRDDVDLKLSSKQDVSEKGNPNGYASLDFSGKVPLSELPSDVTDLSTHSVTELNDVTNAGSGNIITNVERTVLSNQSGINTGDELQASESTSGIAELATQAETDTGIDDSKIVTPLKLSNYSGGALKTKSGIILNASFSGTPKVATVSFSSSFLNTNYSVSLSCNAISGTAYTPIIDNITASGFEINMTVNNINNLTDIRWIAVKNGEN